MMCVRRVSVGGEEDVVVVRSGSRSSEARRRSLAFVGTKGFSDPPDDLPSPVLHPSHPFATAGDSRCSSTSMQPLRLNKAPRSGSKKRPLTRPDSLLLSKAQQAGRGCFETAQTPNDPVEALQSAGDAWSTGTVTPLEEVFEAWRGFPAKESSSLPDALEEAEVQPLSPRTPVNGGSKTAQAQQSLGEIAPVSTSSVHQTVSRTATPSPVASLSSSTATAEVVLARTSPMASPASGLRITYLADVVRENEEKRRLDRQEASSVVALASLEERKRVVGRSEESQMSDQQGEMRNPVDFP